MRYIKWILRIHRTPLLLDITTGVKEACTIVSRHDDRSPYEIEIKKGDETVPAVQAKDDFEEALQMLRARLEERNLLLLINRYRKNAFVSAMARQMSDGKACYLVRMGKPFSRRQIAGSFDPAPASKVVTQREADDFLERWINS
ncbi:hypothetical protein [Nonomuraea sp. B5E05]|uniref:hypothetical protein n=1 Tax=Nonomuraea sp. B5E05 TaxID=3153569 RepID=UPI0032612C54